MTDEETELIKIKINFPQGNLQDNIDFAALLVNYIKCSKENSCEFFTNSSQK